MSRRNRSVAVVLLGLLLNGGRLPAQDLPPDPQAAAHRTRALQLAANYEYAAAIAEYKAAYALDKTMHRKDAALDLNRSGNCYSLTGQYVRALEDFQQGLPIARQAGDRLREAMLLSNMGVAYEGLSQYDKALDYYEQALPLRRQVGDKTGEAATLTSMGMTYDYMSQYAKALDYYAQALPFRRLAGDKKGEAVTLTSIGVAYDHLSQYDKALDYYAQALPIEQLTGDRADEAATLNDAGVAYGHLSQYGKSLDYFQQALPLQRQVGNITGEAATLDNIGNACLSSGRYAQALDYYEQALPIRRLAGDKAGEAVTLSNIGEVYDDLNQPVPARAYDQQALVIERQVADRNGEAVTLSNLMSACESIGDAGAAIFYGKQSVNAYQDIRQNIQSLNRQIQKTYLTSKANTYRTLADLLIVQGRLPEAQQVLKMLKEQEFYDFLQSSHSGQGEPVASISLGAVVFTRREARWTAAYAQAADALTAHGQEQQALAADRERTPAQQSRLDALTAQVQDDQAQLAQVLHDADADFSAPSTAADAPPDTAGTQDLAAALQPGTVAVYTIVAPDTLYSIVVTPAADGSPARTVARSTAVKAEDLYQLVYKLRQALTDPTLDPRPLAGQLYDLVFAPIQKDLDDAHATTLLLSLDDALRYVPPAALYNARTQRYVVQDYKTELITLAGGSREASAAPPLSVLGMGVSTSRDGAPALPGVERELTSIVHEPRDSGGLLPGMRLLDPQFTQAALIKGLKSGRYPLVHIASHFALRPTDADSFLLLGDGGHLSVADLKSDPQRFRGVSLLTLSACDTAMEVKSSTGREVEGFGALAQRLGARSVLASLWPVSDDVTPVLMAAFYRRRVHSPSEPPSESLRRAQLSLLKAAPAALSAPASEAHRGTEAVASASDRAALSSLPPFTPPAGAPYAHPFYWAPFILIGNWR